MRGTRTKLFVYFVLSWLSFPSFAVAAVDAPLANAVQHLDRDAVRHLLERRIDVNAPQADGTTALHWAAYNDDLDLVNRLLAAGANARASNRYGVTPLTLACTNGNAAVVSRLLDAGADANGTLPGGETPPGRTQR